MVLVFVQVCSYVNSVGIPQIGLWLCCVAGYAFVCMLYVMLWVILFGSWFGVVNGLLCGWLVRWLFNGLVYMLLG